MSNRFNRRKALAIHKKQKRIEVQKARWSKAIDTVIENSDNMHFIYTQVCGILNECTMRYGKIYADELFDECDLENRIGLHKA